MYLIKITNIAGRLMPEFPMDSLHLSHKTVVPIKELKRQIERRNMQHIDSVNIIPGVGVHSTWSKYPCEKEETCIDTDCTGKIFVKNIEGDICGFTLVLWAVHWKRKTYILIDRQFREFLEDGNFIECKTENVSY